jgi:hypothetical protein
MFRMPVLAFGGALAVRGGVGDEQRGVNCELPAEK